MSEDGSEAGDYIPPAETDSTDAPQRANRPGQAGFAARLMAKYGWTSGTGLGADGSGMTSALRVQVEKRRRRADADGGGFAEPGGRGRIIEGKKAKTKPADARNEEGYGRMSSVIVLRGMLEGMPDLAAEVEEGLGQEIGEECGEKYGRVERVYIDVAGRLVFIKFTDGVSALRVSSPFVSFCWTFSSTNIILTHRLSMLSMAVFSMAILLSLGSTMKRSSIRASTTDKRLYISHYLRGSLPGSVAMKNTRDRCGGCYRHINLIKSRTQIRSSETHVISCESPIHFLVSAYLVGSHMINAQVSEDIIRR
jgi:hypothetical protein